MANKKMELLKSCFLNYLVLKSIGKICNRLLVLVIPQGKAQVAIRCFATSTINHPLVIDSNMRMKKVFRMLTECRSQPIFFVAADAKKAEEMLKFLASAVCSGYICGKELSAIPVIITEESNIPIGDSYFYVFLENVNFEGSISNTKILPNRTEIVRGVTIYEGYVREKEIEDELKRLFLATSALLCAHREEKLSDYIPIVDELIQADDDYHNYMGLDTVFLDLLERWQEKESFKQVFELPNVESEVDISNSVFYDDRYIFMKETLFANIVSSSKSLPVGAVKRALLDAEILVKERSSLTYPVKMSYVTPFGETKRIRMLRFSRERLCKPGNLDFISACKMQE